MVNNLNMTPPKGENPSDEERRIHCNAPLYSLSDIQEIAKQGNLITVTIKANQWLAKLEMSLKDDVAELIGQLKESDYINSQWCMTSNRKSPGRWVRCDAYKITRREYNQHAQNKYMDADYYIKFSMSKSGKVILIVQCHPQRY